MTFRQEAEARYRQELLKIREQKRKLTSQGSEDGGQSCRQWERRMKALEELERCCKDNLLVLREPALPEQSLIPPRRLPVSARSIKYFFWRQSWSIGGITARTGKRWPRR